MKCGLYFLVAVGVVLSTTDVSFAADRHLKDIVNDPWFWEVTAASGLGWFLGTLKGFSGSKEWLARYGITAPKLFVLIVDFAFMWGRRLYRSGYI